MQKIYAAYHKDKNEIEKSSSGALFVALSEVIFAREGVVFGAAYNYATNSLEHILCKSREERDACRGSKYIQSCISGQIYETVQQYLEMGKDVLYVGTPCQVAGIVNYLRVKNVDAKKLYTCDILCHGVGSPGIWKKFVEWKNRKIDYITFKDKKNGWKNPRCVGISDGKEFSLRGYSWLYFSDAIMRPSCYSCKFTDVKRGSDFTIGDFWKVKSKCPEMYNSRGTSFVCLNSEKALDLFEEVKENLVFQEVDLAAVIQNNMQNPTHESKFRKKVMVDFVSMPTSSFFFKWEIILLIERLKTRIRRKLH